MGKSMTVLEFLKDYIGDNPVSQMTLCQKLKRELNEGAKINAGWEFFIYLLEHAQFGQNMNASIDAPLYHPTNIDLLCRTMLKIGSIDKLLNFLDSFEKNGVQTKVLLDLLLSRIYVNISDFPEIEFNDVIDLINKKCTMEHGTQLRRMDGRYHVIPKLHLKPLLKACPYDTNPYIIDSFDCEDFALSTKTWMAQQGLGNATLFYAEINCYDRQPDGSLSYSFAHGVNLVVVQNTDLSYDVLYLEPQKDSLWKATEDMPWSWGTKVVKLRHLLI